MFGYKNVKIIFFKEKKYFQCRFYLTKVHVVRNWSSRLKKHQTLVILCLAYFLRSSPFLDGDVPRRPSYGVYISQLIRFARVCSHVDDFNTRNKCLTAKLLKQGYRCHKLRKAFF